MAINLRTPADSLFKEGQVTGQLQWHPSQIAKLSVNLTNAQKYVDSEVLRRSQPYIPKDTGALIQSGDISTVIGNGVVTYTTPYANRQYYSKTTRAYDPRRGGQWFERMKADHKGTILDGAIKIAGSGL